ncbi:MAG: hypothetical protein AMXMBFR64_06680 [Myxococcales bacterium]
MGRSWCSAPLLSIVRRAGALALLLLGSACGAPSSPDGSWVTPGAAARVVASAHAALQRGDHEAAYALIDFDEKSRRMLGEIYDGGPPEEQERLHRHLQGQFLRTWEKHWKAPEAAGESWYSTMDWVSPAEARVYLTLPDDPETGRETVELTYIVGARRDGARIIDRTVSIGGRGSTTKLFIELVKRKALPEDGGPVTLARANDAIERLIDSIQIQRIVLGPEHARELRQLPGDPEAPAPEPE